MKYENLSSITEAKPDPGDAFVLNADVRGSTAAIISTSNNQRLSLAAPQLKGKKYS